jgi:hypothetical protein
MNYELGRAFSSADFVLLLLLLLAVVVMLRLLPAADAGQSEFDLGLARLLL